jgi:hypothetical protein
MTATMCISNNLPVVRTVPQRRLRGGLLFVVPELTRRANIQVNSRLSLRRRYGCLCSPHRTVAPQCPAHQRSRQATKPPRLTALLNRGCCSGRSNERNERKTRAAKATHIAQRIGRAVSRVATIAQACPRYRTICNEEWPATRTTRCK